MYCMPEKETKILLKLGNGEEVRGLRIKEAGICICLGAIGFDFFTGTVID